MKPCWVELREDLEAIPEVVEKQVEETPVPEGLGEGRSIVLIGSGDSYAAAVAAENAGFGFALDPLDVRLLRLEAGDAILLSVGGKSRRVVDAARLLASRGFRVIAVTGDPESPLARHAHITIRLVYSRLACGVGAARHAAMMAALAALAGAKPRVERVESGDIPIDSMVVYAGVGVGVASALYAALKTCELLADCASWWHLEQFSHAPVYGTRASIIVLFSDPRLEHNVLEEYTSALRDANFEIVFTPVLSDPWSTAIHHVALIVASAANTAESRNIVEPGYRSHPALERLTRLIYLEE